MAGSSDLRLMCVLAHPDDESMGVGGALAKYAEEGVEISLVTATRGERGRFGDGGEAPPLEVVARTREAELTAAAGELGVKDVAVLGYPDGSLDAVDPAAAIARIAGHIRRVRPHVVITFPPDGAYGHPDHIAISQLTTAAIVSASDPSFASDPARGAHRVSKLYFFVMSEPRWTAYQAALRKLVSVVGGVEREAVPWPSWAITTVIDTSGVSETVRRAVSCHKTQMSIYKKFDALPAERQQSLWNRQELYRVFSIVNGGRAQESDLFEGLR